MRASIWNKLDSNERRTILCNHPGIQAQIARELGVAQSTVSLVWWGKATSARILDAILKEVKDAR